MQQQPPLPKPAEVQQQLPLPKPAEVHAEALPKPAEVHAEALPKPAEVQQQPPLPKPAEVQAEALPKPVEEQQVPPPTKPADVQLKDVSVKVEKNELAMNSNEKNDNVAGIEKIEKDGLHMKSEYANLESEIVELSNIKVSVISNAGAAPLIKQISAPLKYQAGITWWGQAADSNTHIIPILSSGDLDINLQI